ncbi:MAG: ABC transporter substrate binding protein [bacterium]
MWLKKLFIQNRVELMFKKSIIFIIIIILLSFSIYIFKLPQKNTRIYNVLYVASYHETFSWSKDIESGILSAFKDKNMPIHFKSIYMDTKRKSSKKQILSSAQIVKSYILKHNPDIIIISDENALLYVALPMQNTKYNFVFCGVNGEPETYGLPKSNITGVLERHRFDDASRVLRLIDNNIHKIAVISDESETSSIMIKQLKEAKLHVNITEIHQSNSFDEWKNLIKSYQNKVDAIMVILYFTVKDNNGNHINEKDMINMLTSNSDLPEIGLWPFFVDDGGLTAVALKGNSQGYNAAVMAIGILKGRKPTSFKIKPTQDGVIYINAKRAVQLKLNIPPELLDSSKVIW